MGKLEKSCILIFACLAVLAFISWVFMLLWNWVMPSFNVQPIGFWLSVGIVMLLSFVGSFFKK